MSGMLSSDEKILCVCDPNYKKLDILAYITDFCDYGCWYCYNKVPQSKKNLDLDRFYGFLVKIKSELGRDIELELIGGEPSVHPNLLDFCKKAINLVEITIYTNFGHDLEFYRRLSDIGVMFDVTYHEPRGTRNDKFLKNIEGIPKKSLRGITVMLDKDRFDDNFQIYGELKERYPSVDVDFQQVFIGNKLDSYSDCQIATMESSSLSEKDGKFLVKTNTRDFFATHNQIYQMTGEKYRRWVCRSGIDLLYVHVDGKIYRCDGYFNFGRDSIGDIWNGFSVFGSPRMCEVDDCPFQDNVMKTRVFR